MPMEKPLIVLALQGLALARVHLQVRVAVTP